MKIRQVKQCECEYNWHLKKYIVNLSLPSKNTHDKKKKKKDNSARGEYSFKPLIWNAFRPKDNKKRLILYSHSAAVKTGTNL